ncbi:helix-turn-helix domain-containing protein [Olivibacter sp. XZL3]|uniref:helix-turn-helix domain-containing protein n=1 Tax=Olivibacter sp. XZL3 TaxID=1735116 RepID=UPI0010653E5D|nr:helix-turn-helix domain-containing protein [Olivibacter sp. XZL3]
MTEPNEDNHFTVLENKTIGRNLARFRKFREKKALEVADYLGLSEAAYTKYERGESKITIELIQRVSEFLQVDPLQLVASNSGHVVENSNSPNSPIAIQENSSFQTTNEEQTKLITKLVENVIAMNERIMKLLDKTNDE